MHIFNDSVQMLLDIHRDVYFKIKPEDAGRFRDSQVQIADFFPPPAGKLDKLLDEFIAFINTNFDLIDPIEIASFASLWLVSESNSIVNC